MPKEKKWDQERPVIQINMQNHRKLYAAVRRACKERATTPSGLTRLALEAYLLAPKAT